MYGCKQLHVVISFQFKPFYCLKVWQSSEEAVKYNYEWTVATSIHVLVKRQWQMMFLVQICKAPQRPNRPLVFEILMEEIEMNYPKTPTRKVVGRKWSLHRDFFMLFQSELNNRNSATCVSTQFFNTTSHSHSSQHS